MDSEFIKALHEKSLKELEYISKSDLHNHAGRGGNLRYIEELAKVKIIPAEKPFESLSDMQEWFEKNVKCHCSGLHGYLKRIEASFAQAEEDHIKILSLSYGLDEVRLLGGMKSFIKVMENMHQQITPDTVFLPELAFDWGSNVDEILPLLDEVFSYDWFKSVDICNNELEQSIKNFKPIYRKAKSSGLRLKAHVGEFGSGSDVMEAIEELELREVHHGIAVAESPQIMKWISDNRIQLNICPTSNIMLGRVKDYKSHPIERLFKSGVLVTINTDDMLIFNQSVSAEFLNLYNAGGLNAGELNEIRRTGLNQPYGEQNL